MLSFFKFLSPDQVDQVQKLLQILHRAGDICVIGKLK